MKKILLALALIFTAFHAEAAGLKPTYIGVDFGFSYLNGDLIDGYGMDETVVSGGLNVGIMFNENFGAELSHFKSTDSSGRDSFYWGGYYFTDTIKSSYSSLGVDLFGYLPLSNQSSVFFSAGIAKYETDSSSSFWGKDKEDKTAARFGIGMERKIDRNVSVRAMLRYAPVNMDDLDSVTELTAGIKYSF